MLCSAPPQKPCGFRPPGGRLHVAGEPEWRFGIKMVQILLLGGPSILRILADLGYYRQG
jgi:hypothetical protein